MKNYKYKLTKTQMRSSLFSLNLTNNLMCATSRVVDGLYTAEVEREHTGCDVSR